MHFIPEIEIPVVPVAGEILQPGCRSSIAGQEPRPVTNEDRARRFRASSGKIIWQTAQRRVSQMRDPAADALVRECLALEKLLEKYR